MVEVVVMKITLAFILGLIWFVALSALEGLRVNSFRDGDLSGIVFCVLAAVVSAVLVILLLRNARSFALAVAIAIGTCVVLGLTLESPAQDALQVSPLSFPLNFGRGAGAISVWMALGISLAMGVIPVRFFNKNLSESEQVRATQA